MLSSKKWSDIKELIKQTKQRAEHSRSRRKSLDEGSEGEMSGETFPTSESLTLHNSLTNITDEDGCDAATLEKEPGNTDTASPPSRDGGRLHHGPS